MDEDISALSPSIQNRITHKLLYIHTYIYIPTWTYMQLCSLLGSMKQRIPTNRSIREPARSVITIVRTHVPLFIQIFASLSLCMKRPTYLHACVYMYIDVYPCVYIYPFQYMFTMWCLAKPATRVYDVNYISIRMTRYNDMHAPTHTHCMMCIHTTL